MTIPEILSCVAIVLSVISLALGTLNYRRDRSRLKIEAHLTAANEYGPSKLRVGLINVGRRPLIVMTIAGTDGGNRWTAEYLDDQGKGLRLGEHERHDLTLDRESTFHMAHLAEDVNYRFVDLWVQDSLGQRHPVPGARKLLDQLWAD